MDISLINAGLAAGAALAALPVILHLFMRQTPKRVVFPALRLIRERQKRSKKRLRVKNWLLLLARMALLALMALALARPRLTSDSSAGAEDVPTALGFVFDTSQSMGYKQQDKTRLAEAKERAIELLNKVPTSSLVFVIDSSEPTVNNGFSPALARKRIDGLELHNVARPLNVALGLAYTAVASSDKPRHEVYVFTDLARSAWDLEHTVEGLDKVAKDKIGISTHVLRLTPKDPRDVAVIQAGPTAEVVTEGEPVEVRARLRAFGPASSPVAELWVDGLTKGKKQVELAANGEAEVTFPTFKVDSTLPLHQGHVRLSGAADPAEFDDARYFTFRVKPATPVLIVSDQAADAEFIADAIAPDPRTLPPGTPRPFRVDRVLTSKFLEKADNLGTRYRVIFLNNVNGRELSDVEWAPLGGFVREGGGLVVGLGRLTDGERYRGIVAEQTLPATLDAAVPLKQPTTFGQVADMTHPLFSKYPRPLGEVLSQVPVYKYWSVKTHDAGSRVLLSFADKSPALIERVFQGSRTGRVLLWTTPLSRRADQASPDAWNEFPVVGWSFFYLMNQTVAYLSGTVDDSLIFDAGRDVVLPIDPTRRVRDYVASGPKGKTSETFSPASGAGALVIPAPQQLGNWSVKGTGPSGLTDSLGFSVNPPVSETQFVPLEKADLDRLFKGEKNYTLADDPRSLQDQIVIRRVGRELFPWIMFLIMIVVTAESVAANRFYRESSPRPA